MTTSAPPVIDRPGDPAPAPDPAARRRPLARLLLGEREDARWLRPAFWALLVLTAVVYLWDLSASGYANSFYAAAVQAGTKSWTAFFFGSLDSANFITVDKPPASLWVMVLSARLLGFSSTSLLLPQALMAVGTVALTWGTVRRTLAGLPRTTADVGALLAGFVVAATPAAALMFRFDNPDALLVLLMTAAAYCTVRALPRGSWRWIALAGVAIGFAFLTKMLQGFLVLPALGIVYLLAAQATWRKRIVGLAIATGSVLVSAGWWVLAVYLWPAESRPYIGGSTDDTVLDLVFGYNGLGRILGGSGNGGGGMAGGDLPEGLDLPSGAAGMMGGGAAGSAFGGPTGLNRLFSTEMGVQISWLLPAALIALVLALVLLRRRPLADPARAGIVLWGGWLVVTGLTFSFMSGTIHPYYTVALVPAVAGLVGTGGALLWSARATVLGRLGLAAMIGVTAAWAFHLLSGDADWLPWLRWVILVGGLASAVAVVLGGIPRLRRALAAGVLAGTLLGLAGTSAYAYATTTVAHSGSVPSVGPAGASADGMGGMGRGAGGAGGMQRPDGAGLPEGADLPDAADLPAGMQPPTGADPATGDAAGDASGDASGDAAAGGMGTGGFGVSTSDELKALLASSDATWSAAVDGSQSAAELELDTDTAVMAIGGWTSDPTPTLAEFQAYVAAGDIGYYVESGRGGMAGPGGGASTASAIQEWVAANYTAETVGGQTVYDLGGGS